MKALLKSIMATIVLAVVSATAFAENVDYTSSSLSAGQVVSGVALLILVLVLPTFKSSQK
jgi:hypothetical protein